MGAHTGCDAIIATLRGEIATLLELIRKYEWHEGCGCKFGSRGGAYRFT